MLRIIDTKTHVTLREINKTRGQAILSRCKVNNSELLEKKGFPDYKIISSSQKNFHIKTFCFIPQGKFSQHQEDLIKGITNQLEMIFIIFSSNYYKNF